MASMRDRPYTGFNFLVNLGDGDTASVLAGFQEISALSQQLDVIEYRAGNSKVNAPLKLNGLNRVSDVTLRRGVIGSLDLYRWLNDIRDGGSNGLRTVSIELQNEDRSSVVQTWRLINARIVRHSSGPFHAKSSEVAIEELVLAFERLEME